MFAVFLVFEPSDWLKIRLYWPYTVARWRLFLHIVPPGLQSISSISFPGSGSTVLSKRFSLSNHRVSRVLYCLSSVQVEPELFKAPDDC